MANIRIANLPQAVLKSSEITEINAELASAVNGGFTSWHIYHNADGNVIGREYEDDGVNEVIHHRA